MRRKNKKSTAFQGMNYQLINEKRLKIYYQAKKAIKMCDALGQPIKFILTGGEVSDFKPAIPLLKAKQADYVITDKGYDSDEIISYIK